MLMIGGTTKLRFASRSKCPFASVVALGAGCQRKPVRLEKTSRTSRSCPDPPPVPPAGAKTRPLVEFRGGRAMSAVALTVNGKAVTGDVDPRTLLVQFLRENLRLTGTHVGCDTSQCGACVVHVNGKAVKSCSVFVWQIEGADVLTIEGLADPNGPLHPMQEAFREHHGLQCGYCTPGMIMTAVDMVNRKGNDLDDPTIRHELEGNLCRCTGYHNIVKAIAAGARAMAKGPGAAHQADKAAE